MKKIFLLITAALMTAGIASAQDINEATTNYNNGATELQMGNLEAALTNFQTALQMGEALGEEASELVENCKSCTGKQASVQHSRICCTQSKGLPNCNRELHKAS